MSAKKTAAGCLPTWLILLAAAPCTAMVFVWSRLTNGDPLFTLSQVALNDSIMVVAFAPMVAFLLGISAITVPWDTLITSVVLYIVIPVILAQNWRSRLLSKGKAAFDAVFHKQLLDLTEFISSAALEIFHEHIVFVTHDRHGEQVFHDGFDRLDLLLRCPFPLLH